MGYKLELGAWSAVFAVPNALVDRYIKEADGDQLKVMLWLLRHNGRPYAAEDLAAALGITPQRVDTALGFWMKRFIRFCESLCRKQGGMQMLCGFICFRPSILLLYGYNIPLVIEDRRRMIG